MSPNHSGFFSTGDAARALQKTVQRTLVDTGGQGDSPMRALAACLIDWVLGPQSAQDPMVKKIMEPILERHFETFPAEKPHIPAADFSSRTQSWILSHRHHLSRLIVNLACTLRQIAVDEMEKDPQRYADAFVMLGDGNPAGDMRNPATPADKTWLVAISNATGLPLQLEITEPGKPVFLRSPNNMNGYPPDAPRAVISCHHGHYAPKVLHPETFRGISPNLTIRPEEYPAAARVGNKSSREVREEIRRHEHRLQETFESTRHALEIRIAAGEIDKEKLIDLYIRSVGSSEGVRDPLQYPATAHGSQSFFESWMSTGLPGDTPGTSQDAHVIRTVAEALARAVSIGDIPYEHLFQESPDQDSRQASRRYANP